MGNSLYMFFRNQEMDEIGVHATKMQKILLVEAALFVLGVLFQVIFMAVRHSITWTAFLSTFCSVPLIASMVLILTKFSGVTGWILIPLGLWASYRRNVSSLRIFSIAQIVSAGISLIFWPVIVWYYTASKVCGDECNAKTANGIIIFLFIITIFKLAIQFWSAILAIKIAELISNALSVVYDVFGTPVTSSYTPPSYIPPAEDESSLVPLDDLSDLSDNASVSTTARVGSVVLHASQQKAVDSFIDG